MGSDDAIAVGKYVEVHGTSSDKVNGLVGKVLEWKKDKERWAVHLNCGVKNLLPKNLKVTEKKEKEEFKFAAEKDFSAAVERQKQIDSCRPPFIPVEVWPMFTGSKLGYVLDEQDGVQGYFLKGHLPVKRPAEEIEREFLLAQLKQPRREYDVEELRTMGR